MGILATAGATSFTPFSRHGLVSFAQIAYPGAVSPFFLPGKACLGKKRMQTASTEE
jgi:hypothetical protein